MLPLTAPVTGGFGLLLGLLAHTTGWPVVTGGSARLIEAMIAELTELGGRVETGRWVRAGRGAAAGRYGAARRHAPPAGPAGRRAGCPRATCGRCAGSGTGRACARSTGRWTGRSRGPRRPAGRPATVHLGGTLAEVAASEARGRRGAAPGPAVLPGGPAGVADPGRAPARRARAVGVLPRAVRVHGRHVRADRGADRAVRARLPRPGAGPVGPDGRRPGRLQPELRGRRHQRRGRHAAADAAAAGAAVEPLPHARPAACTCARPPPRRAAACTACAATGRPAPRCATWAWPSRPGR